MKIINGDSLEVLKRATPNSIDAIVCDPPYGLSFMGKKWDYDVPSVELWQECLRVLKPGGYLLAFAGTRTQHRMAVRIEDAGFEIRDMIAWIYGSGFPKSLSIGKAVDKLQGKDVMTSYIPNNKNDKYGKGMGGGITDNTPSDNEFNGWGTALKPALEPITVARKPLSEKTVAENVLRWGTGGINIDGSRVGTSDKYSYPNGAGGKRTIPVSNNELGRFPANLIHDGSEEVMSLFPYTKSGAVKNATNNGANQPINLGGGMLKETLGSEGSASRFFYCAKSSKSERNKGTEAIENGNNHSTVKPIALMEYLVKLVTPVGGKVLDPFMGSGTTGIACAKLGFDFIGIELDADYCKIAEARINNIKLG